MSWSLPYAANPFWFERQFEAQDSQLAAPGTAHTAAWQAVNYPFITRMGAAELLPLRLTSRLPTSPRLWKVHAHKSSWCVCGAGTVSSTKFTKCHTHSNLGTSHRLLLLHRGSELGLREATFLRCGPSRSGRWSEHGLEQRTCRWLLFLGKEGGKKGGGAFHILPRAGDARYGGE